MNLKLRVSSALLLAFLLTSSCSADDISQRLNGTWSNREVLPSTGVKTVEFTWGEGVRIINHSLEFDFGYEVPKFTIGGMGTFEIVDVENIDSDSISIVFFFARGNFNVEYVLHIIAEDMLWVENKSTELQAIRYGEKNVYFRNSKP